jgi:flagellar motility protein MotE (MotC chaperone)
MKAKLLLSIVIINIICVGIYLILRPATVEAENKKPPAKTQQQQVTADAGQQMEMIRQREEQIKSREMELTELERQVSEKIKRLEALEQSLKTDLEAYKVINTERVKQLVKIYSSMKPRAAATLMNNMDIDVSVQVFINMKGDIAGGILSYMEPQKAAAISQRLMTYRSGGGGPVSAAPGTAPVAEKGPATQKSPSSAPAFSSKAEKPPAVVKAHAPVKESAVVKTAAPPDPALASVSTPAPVFPPASAPTPAPMSASVSTPMPASAPASAAEEHPAE